jgi:4-amino-4-deoxy-L-arabinose transferase-like glycosyltransferase
MENFERNIKGTYFFIALAGIFMLIICHSWLSDGMFLDGTLYATFSRNMANGLGTFWQPHLTNILFPAFFEHPPLALGLESVLFRVFGDSRFVERFYSLMTIFITAIIIVSIWKLIVKKSSTGWLPVLFWISMPTVNWASVNNMLENTLVIFICLSVLFYIRSQKSNRIVFLFLAGLMLSCGFLVKGFVTFTPLALPFIWWMFSRNSKFSSMVFDTVVILISAVLPLILLFLFTGAHEFLPKYIEMAFYKISEGVTSSSRFYIINRLVMELLPAFGIILALMLYSLKKKLLFNNIWTRLLPAAAFFTLGLAGVLPIMLTRDQSAYFLILSFPFFAISFGLTVNPLIEILLQRIDYNSRGYRLFRLFGIIALSTGIVLSVIFSGDINRDKNKLKDMRVILGQLKENSTVNIMPEMYPDWSLHAYYARYKNISLDPDLNNQHEYLLITTSMYSDTINNRFERIDLKTIEYELFRRKIGDTIRYSK